MASILSSLGSIVDSALSMISSVVTVVTNQPLILLYVLIPLVGIGVGMFKRLINVN